MPDRISEGYTDALNAIAEAGREIARAVASVTATPPWIDAQEAAEQPQPASRGNRTGGGLGERLRAEAEAGRVGQHGRLSAIADEVDRLEGQADRVRRAVTELAWIFQNPTDGERQMLDAFEALIEQALDGPKPESEEGA